MDNITVNIERREKVPEWQKRAWGEFMEELDKKADTLLKEGAEDENRDMESTFCNR